MTILVIEDDSKHRAHAKTFFATVPDVNVLFANNYDEAGKLLFKGSDFDPGKREGNGTIDGVISDIYFPLVDHDEYSNSEPIGVRIAIELKQANIPFVLNTSYYHHGRKCEWISRLARHQGWKIIDSGSREKIHGEASCKNWKGALDALLKLIKLIE